jgi:hypothetical protein
LHHGSITKRILSNSGQFFCLGPFPGFSFFTFALLFGFLRSFGGGLGSAFFFVFLRGLLTSGIIIIIVFLFLFGRGSIILSSDFFELNLTIKNEELEEWLM